MSVEPRAPTLFVPLLLPVLAILAGTAFQTASLIAERAQLQSARAAQSASLDQALKIRNAADALALRTQRLAEEGNPNAQMVIGGLRRRGITINPQAHSNSAPP